MRVIIGIVLPAHESGTVDCIGLATQQRHHQIGKLRDEFQVGNRNGDDDQARRARWVVLSALPGCLCS